MKRTITTLIILLLTTASFASAYPDSVMSASKDEYRIEKGLNFDISGGVGVSSYLFHQIGAKYASPHTSNALAFPVYNGGIGLNGYFLPWMGLGIGVQFSTYANTSRINKPWQYTDKDYQGQEYILTATPENLTEHQSLYMLEVPLTLRFRGIKRNVGFHGALGAKVGLPIYDRYSLDQNGKFANEITYEHWALTYSNIPGVIEDATIPAVSGKMGKQLRTLNYAAYAEIGMLFRLQQRLDLLLALAGTYYFSDVMASHSGTELGFDESFAKGEYPSPFKATYQGVLASSEVQALHPWQVVLKLGLSINTGKTQAQRAYDREQREKERAAREAERAAREAAAMAAEPEPVVVSVEEPEAEPEQPCEKAREQILAIAEQCGLNLCELFCQPIHDTLYITHRDTIIVAKLDTVRIVEQVETSSVHASLDAALQTAIIWFRLDDATPILQPEDILEQIAEILVRHPEQKIQVNGHACELGRTTYNQRLALKRAKAVAEQLRKLGVKEEQMIVRSLGEDEPFRYNSKHQLHKDRRVEIIPVP